MRSSNVEFSKGSYDHHNQINQKTIFLPMLCKVSIKDIKLNHYKNQSSSADPSSPKVSCMGQVKRNNRVISFPTTYRLTAAATSAAAVNHHHHHNKYTKLKKLFSSKALMPATTSTATIATSRRSCRSSREMCVVDSRKSKIKDQESVKEVNIDELDPPLPVVKRVQQPQAAAAGFGGRDEVNLWKRRFGGATIKSLQIEQIQLPNDNVLPPTTV
ncbi:unnamed protein product [Fraxinus pennsylvanica]|uniref:Uncharacterized protein n=1 Tax=Fraxinus pennsylvanica TaxID=56036 RepID=A0AAD1Z7Z5_9LAMI|nr:unnamed protein product [Fraxinus pennsylvanica]